MKFTILTLSLIVLTIFSCKKENEEELATNAKLQELCTLDTIRYTEHIKPIITVNCISCHSNTIASGGITLEDYADLNFLALDGILLNVVSHNSGVSPMPKGGTQLHECQIKAFQVWASQGALDN